jgi:hypothetical protein
MHVHKVKKSFWAQRRSQEMKSRLVWIGILTTLLALCNGCAPAPLGVTGGYMGWRNEGTNGQDAKLTAELNIQSADPLLNGLWVNYVNYDNTGNGQNVKGLSTYVDHSAPAGLFTTDGARRQHFTDHVGVLVAQATDANHDGIICWIGCRVESGSPGGGDYTLESAFCPVAGGTGSPNGTGFKAYCDRGHWPWLMGAVQAEETKSGVGKGLPYGTPQFFIVLGPAQLAQVISTSTALPDNTGIVPTVTAVSLANGSAHTLSTPITFNAYLGGVSINGDQPGLKELASWLSGEWMNQPDGEADITFTLNGAVNGTISIASGHSAAVALQNYASW